MLLATRERFEPANAAERATAWYYTPQGDGSYLGYREYPFFQQRVNQLKGRFAPAGQKLLVAGCGFGYLVKQCVDAGYDAYGCDASSYAITRGQALLPTIAARLLLADVTVAAQVEAVRVAMGLPGSKKIDLCVTEDLLPCLTDAEIALALAALRSKTQANLLHIITPSEASNAGSLPEFNWKARAAWAALVAPDVAAGPDGAVF